MLERIYDLIRKEEVVLWIGAGFSKYAGYPMGSELAKILYDNLSLEEQKDVDTSEPFENIAQAYVDFRGNRTFLIETLRKEYASKVPVSTLFHDKLAKVPHIKTIITTNFDCLLENSFNEDAVVIVNDSDIPKIKENKTTIIKIHGDFTSENKIVVTKDDYANFIQTNLTTAIWNVVIERMLTKNIVFIGYNIEDVNTIALIEKINDALGEKRKDVFFISPIISKRKQSSLELKKIIPINKTGEEFVSGLIKNLDDNLLIDTEKGIVPIETCNEYLRRRGAYSTPIYNKKGFSINQLYSDIKQINTEISLSLNDPEFLKSITDKNNTRDTLIPKNKIIRFEGRSDGMKLPISNIENLKSITLISIAEETTSDFVFEKEEYCLSNIPTEIYKAQNAIRCKCTFNAGFLSIETTFSEDSNEMIVFIEANHKDKIMRPSDELIFAKLIFAIFSGEKFTFITQSNRKVNLQALGVSNEQLDELKMKLDHYVNLRIIEKHCKIIFDDIIGISDYEIQKAEKIVKHIKGELIDNSSDIYLRFTFSDYTENKTTISIDDDIFEAYLDEIEKTTIYGKQIVLGRKKIIVHNPQYHNLEEVMKKIKNRETTELILTCKANTIFISYDQIENNRLSEKN